MASYRLSKYVRVVDCGENLFVYNTANGAKAFVYEPHLLSQVRRLIDGSITDDELDPRLLDKFCVEAGADEFTEFTHRIAEWIHRTDTLGFIMIPTSACNFDCVYCYEDHKPGTMSRNICDLLYSAVARYAAENPLKKLSVDWFGGEPLLAHHIIVYTNRKMQSFCRENGITFQSGITTNGYLLTVDRVRQLLELGVRMYSVTIDGGPSTHDRYRPLKGGLPTWETVMGNLERMKDIDQPFQVMVRVNYNLEILETIEELLDAIDKRLNDARFHLFFHTIGCWGGPNDRMLDVVPIDYHPFVLQHLLKLCMQHVAVPRTHLSTGLPGSEVCYAARADNFTVMRDGSLGKCTMFTLPEHNELNVVGDIREGRINIDREKLDLWLNPGQLIEQRCCHDCFYYPCCQANACPLARLRGHMPCSPMKESADDLIRIEYEYYSKRKQGA